MPKNFTKTEEKILACLEKMGEYGVEVQHIGREYQAMKKLVAKGLVRVCQTGSGFTYIRKGTGSYTYYKRIDRVYSLIRKAD